MQILIHKKQNGVGNYSYQKISNGHKEIGSFEKYENALLYAKQEGFTKIIHDGENFIVLEYENELWRNK